MRVALELWRVALHFGVEKRVKLAAFVLARLEIDDPAPSIRDESAVEADMLERRSGAQRQPELRARIPRAVRAPTGRAGRRARGTAPR